MLSNLWFITKTALITMVIVIVMQLKVGGHTIEAHSMAWLHNSFIAQTIQSVAMAGALSIERGYQKVVHMFSKHAPSRTTGKSENVVGNREKIFRFKRANEESQQGEQPEAAATSDKDY
jgi:hypothetical protein